MRRRTSSTTTIKRTSILHWRQTVIDETKDFVDDNIDRLRDEDAGDELAGDIQELNQAVAELNAKLDRIAPGK
jgi:hypothetical protein